jgi:uncharacterized RDD family membrane protein YckC
LRGLRPELPAGLEAVVQRGLDRDRDRRFQSLAALRSALLPFLPGRMSIGGIGLRVWAHLIDLALFLILSALLGVLLPLILSPQRAERLLERFDPFISLGLDALGVAYFALLEGLWGASLGKWLCGLRVVTADGKAPPGLTRGLLRALTFFLIMVFPDDLLWAYWGEPSGRGGLRETEWDLLLLSTATLATTLAGVLVLIAPMRPHSGFRGTHEWLSGTKVVRLRRARWRRARAAERKLVVPASGSTWSGRPMGVPDQLGPFQIKGAVHWGPQRRVLLGEDPALGRTVWIALRAPDAAPPSPARQELSRLTRLRWLTGGNSPEGRWDAYLAPAGCPLRVLAAEHGLSWADTRPILEDLVEELTLAAQDGTLPPRLDVEDVWVEPDGHPILIDLLENQPGIADPFRFVLQTAALALQGAAGQPDSTTAPRAIRKPLPRHAARLLDRLLGRQPPYGQIAELLDDLRADADLPTEVGRARRAGHLLLQAALLAPGLILLFSVSYLIDAGKLAGLNPHLRGMIVAAGFGWPLLWVLWAGLTRGGLSLRLSSLALVTRDNRPAGFGRCAWRATVVWLPVVGLLVGSILLDRAWPHLAETVRLLWWVALASLPAAVLSALVRPERGPHDRLAGTYLVPQ